MSKSEEFLRWLSHSPEIWGEEILKIKDCEEDYLVAKFTSTIERMLTTETKIKSELFEIKGDGWQGITGITNKGFKIKNLEDCQKIGIYLVYKIRFKCVKNYTTNKYDFIPEIHKEYGDRICLFISKGEELK